MSVQAGSGEMIVIIDMKGLSFGNVPPMSVIRAGISLLQLHYPYRLHSIYFVNAGNIFSLVWKSIKPLLSKRTTSKVSVLKANQVADTLQKLVGADNLEKEFGGMVEEIIEPVAYFSEYCTQEEEKRVEDSFSGI